MNTQNTDNIDIATQLANEFLAKKAEQQRIIEDVRNRYWNHKFPSPVMEPLYFGRLDKTPIKDRKALVDRDTGNVFNICSDQYQIIHHEEVLKALEDTFEQVPEYGTPEINVKSVDRGAKMRVEAIFKDVKIGFNQEQGLFPKVDFFNSYDLGWKLGFKFGAFRQICTNGMMVGTVHTKANRRHLRGLSVQLMVDQLASGLASYSEQQALWQKWAEERVTMETLTAFIDDTPFGKQEKEDLYHMPITGDNGTLLQLEQGQNLTVWNLHNATSEFVTHRVKNETRKVELEDTLESMFMNRWRQ